MFKKMSGGSEDSQLHGEKQSSAQPGSYHFLIGKDGLAFITFQLLSTESIFRLAQTQTGVPVLSLLFCKPASFIPL